MTWYFIDSGFNTGKFNMEFDLLLAERCNAREAYFRLYRWDPYCISLGAGQDINNVNILKAETDNIDVVKRPTGGRAVLHAEEITYSVVLPVDSVTSAKKVYFEINAALAEGLKRYNPLLGEIEMEQTQIKMADFYKTTAGAVCFAAPSKNELKYSGRKIVGSAQRKMNNVILQHGSILCGNYHKKISEYLNLNSREMAEINDEIEVKTIDIETVTGTPVNYDQLKVNLSAGFEYYFNIKLNRLDKSIYSYWFPANEHRKSN